MTEIFNWRKFSKDDLLGLPGMVSKMLQKSKQEIIGIPSSELSFQNYFVNFQDMEAKLHEITNSVWCFINLHTDDVLRDTARSVEIEISKIMREFAYDEEIYQTFKKYFETNFKAELKNKILDDEAVKIVRDTEEGYKKMGMHLSKKDKKTLLQIKNKITKLASEYEKLATANYAKGQYFKKEELKGIPENIIQNFKFDEKKKKYFVRILPTEMSYVSKYCEIEDTRKKLAEIAALGVGDKNTKKLAEVLKLRNQMSKMVGYKTFAELAVSKEMVSSPREIDIFLKGLLRKLNPFFKKEKKKDLQILTSWQKKNLLGKRQSKKLQSWNWMFAENLSKENELKVKEEEYKPYFELENSIEVLFKIWKEFFNVGTEKVEGFEFFHKTERVYKFKDLRTGESLGYGVFDLFPREGKYGHACMNNVSHEKLIYLVCNFMQNTSGKNLLSFNDVVTLFHEAGHFLHFLLMKPKYQASRHVSNDFVEIPSQFFENFVMDENFVKENFKHFETGETMPDRLLKKVPKLSKKGEASAWVIQSMYSLFDQELHGKNTSKYFKNFKQIDKLFGGLYEKILGIETFKRQHFASRFSHILHGYESKYYSYVVSKVYSVDFWSVFASKGVVPNEKIQKYKKLLEAGGSKEEISLVKEYLGRKVSLKPFLKSVNK